MRSECLDYRQLPDQNPLFLEYLYHFDRVEAFYSPAYLSLEHLKRRADSVVERPVRFPRERLAALLSSFNERIGAGPSTFENIQKLGQAKTVAVVTGQQVGLFGGPAMSVYKAATAIKIAQLLEQSGYSAVPVFWLASDDSDFEEVRSTQFFNQEGGPLLVNYPGSARSADRMVGDLPLGPAQLPLNQVQKEADGGEFREVILDRLRRAYRSSGTLRESFGCWINSIFADYGLVIFDPLLPGYKSGLTAVFSQSVRSRQDIVAALEKRAQRMNEGGFSAQVHTDASETLLFWIDGEKRYKLECVDGRYRTKSISLIDLTEAEMLQAIEEGAENFAPNVLLRPIVQDHLFPTAVYVAGPAEISYYSQISAISPIWNLEMAVFPRVGLTVVDRKAQRLLKKYELKPRDIFSSTQFDIIQRIMEKTESQPALGEMDRLRTDLEKKLQHLRQEIGTADPTVAEMLSRSERKMLYQLDKVRKRFVMNYRTRSYFLARHLDYLYSHLYPDNRLQERLVNFNHFLFQEGPEFVPRLMSQIAPFCRGHQIFYV